MLVLRGPEQAAGVSDASMRGLIEQRFATLSEEEPFDPDALGYFVVLEPGDTLEALDAQLGFAVLTNRFNGSRFGEPGFTPSFEIVEEHPSCYEMVFVLCDDGFGVVVFLPKGLDIDERLLALCRRYAIRAQEPSQP